MEELRPLNAAPKPRPRQKQLDHLDRHCRRLIELSPFLIMTSSDGDTPVESQEDMLARYERDL